MNKKANEIKKIGIIGGGQLGKMMILEGKKMGLYFLVLDPKADCPAASIADEMIIADFHDPLKIKELAEKSHVITYEFEHINAEVLIQLENMGHKIYPSPQILKTIQDKYLQKQLLKTNNIPVADFTLVDSLENLNIKIKDYGFPTLLKNCCGGYDGKGNYLIKKQEDVKIAMSILGKAEGNLLLEAFIPFKKEISIVVARGIDGEIKTYPICENIHEDNILKMTIFPAQISEMVAEKAKQIALKTMEILDGVGVFCIEMFITADDEILVNEIAPRTHNSGHYTIEACSISQFAQQIRSICHLPLGEIKLTSCGVMLNLLGEKGYKGKANLIGVVEALALANVFVHYYGKTETAPQRKMGHITLLGESLEDSLEKAEKITNIIKVIGEEVVCE